MSAGEATVAGVLAAVAGRWNGYNARPEDLHTAMAAQLDCAGLLMTPEIAAELDRLRSALSEATDSIASLDSEIGGWSARVAELEGERHSTNEALSDAAEAIRAKDTRIAAQGQAVHGTLTKMATAEGLRATISGWAKRCREAESLRNALRVRNAELEAAAAAGPSTTWFLAEEDGGLPTLHATLESAQDWALKELAEELQGRSVDWFEEDGLHFLRFTDADSDRPLHRTTVSVVPLTVEGAALTVYRASNDSVVSGLFTTAGVARARCEAFVRREHPRAALSWLADEDDDPLSPSELVADVGDEEYVTGYVVTPLVVESSFDPAGDE